MNAQKEKSLRFYGGSNKSKNDLRPEDRFQESKGLPRDPVYLMINTFRGILIPGRTSFRIKGVRKNERKAHRNG
jgi:hypothetical protein